MKLYYAIVEVETMFVVPDDTSAQALVFEARIAAEQELEEGNEIRYAPKISQMQKAAELPLRWRDSIPWGETEERTCAEILAANISQNKGAK